MPDKATKKISTETNQWEKRRESNHVTKISKKMQKKTA